MAKNWCLFVLLYAVISVKWASSEPNIQLSLTDKGLNYVNKVLVHNLVKHVQGLNMPPITVKNGFLSLSLSNSRVHKVQLKSASFGVNSGFLELEIHMNQLAIEGDYVSSGWWWLSGSGRFTASVKGLDIVQRLALGHNSKGQPIVNTAECKAQIRVSCYRFDQSFLLSALSNLAKRSFQPTVERKICDAVSKAISKKGKVLPTLYPETHLLAGLPCSMVSYPITKQPIVEQDYVDFLITGKVISTCRPSNQSSRVGKKITRLVPNKHKMLSISFSDDFLNLLLHRHYELISASIQAVTVPTVQTTSNGSVLSFKAKTRAWIKSQGSSKMSMPLDRIDSFESKVVFQEKQKKISAKVMNLRAHPKPPLHSKAKNAVQVSRREIRKLMGKLNASFMDLVPLPLMDEMRLVNQTIIYQKDRVTMEMDIQV